MRVPLSARPCTIALLALSTMLAGCCEEPICHLRATPLNVCPASIVTLNWSTGGNPVRIDPTPGPVNPGGETQVPVSATTTFTLTSTRNGRTETRTRTVQVHLGDVSESRTEIARPCDAEPFMRFTLEDTAWDALFEVTRVRNLHSEGVTVSHAGRDVPIEAGEISEAFRGTPFRGEWVVRANRRAIPAGCTAPVNQRPDPNNPPTTYGVTVGGMCRR
jgi:hypothetical protein